MRAQEGTGAPVYSLYDRSQRLLARWDAATGQTCLGARYLHQKRFSSPDPAELNPLNPNGLNRYAYANNNPMRFVDPDGHAGQKATCADKQETCSTAQSGSDSEQGNIRFTDENASERIAAGIRFIEKMQQSLNGQSFASPLQAGLVFGDTFSGKSRALGIEFGSNIVAELSSRGSTTYVLRDFVVSRQVWARTGMGGTIIPVARPGDGSYWGFVHTHPSGPPGFSYGDIDSMVTRNINGIVIQPNGEMTTFSVDKYKKQGYPGADHVYYNQIDFLH